MNPIRRTILTALAAVPAAQTLSARTPNTESPGITLDEPLSIKLGEMEGNFKAHALEKGKFYIIEVDPTRVDMESLPQMLEGMADYPPLTFVASLPRPRRSPAPSPMVKVRTVFRLYAAQVPELDQPSGNAWIKVSDITTLTDRMKAVLVGSGKDGVVFQIHHEDWPMLVKAFEDYSA